MPSPFRHPLALAVCSVLAGSLSLSAWSAELPKRKSGLWEIHTQIVGAPSPGPMKMCVDANTDNLMQEQPGQKPDCSAMDVKQSGNKVTIHTVCRMDKTTVTTDGVLIGDFSSGYKSDMTMRYSPPLQGMKETRMTQETRWLGPCAKGQKPGDIIMPNMGTFNPAEMMKDPRFKEMLQQHQH
ncbi:MAG: DUF3617 family protein [Azospira sp.]|nr:DUF3617 family protein [Azospira sp.]